jgi:hypothetical protein
VNAIALSALSEVSAFGATQRTKNRRLRRELRLTFERVTHYARAALDVTPAADQRHWHIIFFTVKTVTCFLSHASTTAQFSSSAQSR